MHATTTPVRRLAPGPVAAWRELAAQTAVPSPFSEADLVVAAARHLRGGRSAQLLQVWDGARLELALPLHRSPVSRRLPLPTWSSWTHEYCFFGAPLLRGSCDAGQVWAVALRHLRASSHLPWLRLDLLPATGAVRDGLVEAARACSMALVVLDRHERAAVLHPADRPAVTAQGRGHRTLRRLRRRLAEHLGAPVQLVDRTGDPAALELFLQLEAAGWKGRAGTAMASRASDASFLRELARSWPERVQLLLLDVGGRAVAAQVNLLAGRSCFCFKVAYDEQLARFSPGTLLEVDVVAHVSGGGSFDLVDSCTTPGHPIERLFPDRRAVESVAVGLTRAGSASLRAARRVRGG